VANRCILAAPAKINLYLEILGDRPDGFHELVMVMQSVALADRLELVAKPGRGIHIHCDHPDVPTDETNLAYRAAQLMQTRFPDRVAALGQLDITIHKYLPIAAGLAGGSSNAAAVLVGLDVLANLGLTQPDLQELAAELGSDVPFCIGGGTAIATGRGENIAPIHNLTGFHVVLAKYRNFGVSTPWAYQTFRSQFADTYITDPATLAQQRDRVHASPIVQAISHNDGATVAQLLHNDLEKVVLPAHPAVQALRDAMTQPEISGFLGAMMSGSGPTVFALLETEAAAIELRNHVAISLNDPDLELWVTELYPHGITLVSP